jgi:tetratricopeptide (TPR) repeat protein
VVPARDVAHKTLESRARPARTVAPAPIAVDPAIDQALLLRQTKIVEAYLSFRRKDSFDFLELPEDATEAEIDQRYLTAAQTYAPWSLEAMGVTDFAEQGELLFLRAARAYAELRGSESRGALLYRRKVLRDQEADRKKAKFAIETDLLDPEEQFQRGLVLAERGELGKALELLEFAVDCDPQSALYRAELAFRRDEFEAHRYRKQSIADLTEAARIDPQCGTARYYLGLILASEGDLAGAEAALRASIKLMAPDRRPIEALRELSSKKKR